MNIYNKNTSEMKSTFFEKIRKSRTSKGIVMLLLLTFTGEIVAPTCALALTAGPSSPEFASFEPVATTDMVNDFTGDFTYNLPVLSVPGPDGGGYSMSLSYHSGVSPEEESSWVGSGWTLNPGAINRSKRGVADDFNGADVIQYNKIKPNWTQTSGFDFNVEINSSDKKEKDNDLANQKKDAKKKQEEDKSTTKSITKFGFSGINGIGGDGVGANSQSDDENPFGFKPSLTFQHSIRFNNYSGFTSSKGLSGAGNSMASLSMNSSGGETTMGFSVNPMAILSGIKNYRAKKAKEKAAESKVTAEKPTEVIAVKKLTLKQKIANDIKSGVKGRLLGLTAYTARSYNAPAVPYSVAYNAGRAFNYSVSLQIDPYGPLGFQAGIQGSMNYQVNYPEVTSKAYGYQHNQNIGRYKGAGIIKNDDKTYKEVLASDILQGDFHIEKETTFDKHDKNLGIPFNSADIFTSTGNGVTGGFQFHHNKVGHYFPNFLKNKQTIHQLGIELGIGGTISIGFDAGLGFQKTMVGDWNDLVFETANTNTTQLEFDATLPSMRFSGDLGGEVAYSGNNDLLFATVKNEFKRKLNLENFVIPVSGSDPLKYKNHLKTEKEGKTSYIEYSCYADGVLANPLDNSLPLDVVSGVNYIVNKGTNYNDLVGQIAVTNKDGNRSVYGIPVFTQNENELSIGLENDNDENKYTKQRALNFNNPLANYSVTGSKTDKPWASTYLLTQTTTSDYIDVDNNGPSELDFGGWTKFGYNCVYGKKAGDNWYRYRAPYNGLFYNRGRLNDLHDGSGSMSSGDKEVYFLKTVETKTHVAFFITNKTESTMFSNVISSDEMTTASRYLTGSLIERKDGYGANKTFSSSGEEAAAMGAVGSDRQQNLEKIVLFSKTDMSKPISTTFFEYNNTLCPNTPNTENSTGGKLTLKRVWTEGGGVTKTKVAPFQFEYNYFRYEATSPILRKYPNIDDVYDHLPVNQNLENPNYEPGQLDAWGNYQPNGQQRFTNMQPWLDQTQTSANFDPAAWQLKRIILPSGGEIHVHYEQKDYTYVQNKKATVMVDLTEATIQGKSDDDYKKFGYKAGDRNSNDSKYYINTNTLKLTATEIGAYKTQLYDHFVSAHNKLYYKFLYSLRGDSKPSLADYTDIKLNQKREYISGYISVNDVDSDSKGVFLCLGDVDKIGKMDKNLPRWIGFKTLLSNGLFALPQNGSEIDDAVTTDDNELFASAYQGNYEDDDFESLKKKARVKALDNTFDYFGRWVGGAFMKPHRKNICRAQNFELSYFKLPIYHSKLGGGCRVKRLVSYDPGINGETGDEMVYGTEYLYKLHGSNLSSGVATFEPGSIREENALVGIVERKTQKKIDKLLNGKDSKVFEGPIGESLYPGASIGYSRIITKNIHSGKTTTGYAVNKYWTCFDFPLEYDCSELKKDNDTYRKLNLSLPLGLINVEIHKAWVTQGYIFKLNDKHGKPRRMATFAGNYSTDNAYQPPTSETVYHYSGLGEPIKALSYDPNDPNDPNDINVPRFEIADLKLGQEEDMTMYRSKVEDVTNNFSLEIDLNITLPVAITLGGALSYSYSQNELSQHVTSKVIHQSSFLLSTTSTVDGVTQTTENIAFNKYTGDPVLTRTYDGYTAKKEKAYVMNSATAEQKDGHYYSLTIPGSWIYKDLGQKSTNVLNSNQLGMSVGSIVTYGTNELASAVYTNQSTYTGGFASVVSASSVILKKDWFTTGNDLYDEINNEFEGIIPAIYSKLNENYYPFRSYVFRDQTIDANGIDASANKQYIYQGGVLRSPLTMFDWYGPDFQLNELANGTNSGTWFSGSKVLAYSPNGVGVAEEDILGIRSIAKFNDDKTLPILTAQNANYNQVFFKDYENKTSSPYNNKYAHTGRKSLDLTLNNGAPIIHDYDFTNINTRGVGIKLWLKSSLSEIASNANYGKKNLNPQLKASIDGQTYSFKKIAQTGEWTLYDLEIPDVSGITGPEDITLSYATQFGELVLIDDVRIQPLDALMSCTVYKKDKKVEAQFDNQHFAVFFEYNNEGSLIRKSIETERGKKTLQEQHQNTPTILKN